MVRRMYQITKSELIYILDLGGEMQDAGGSCESFTEELQEATSIVGSILDHPQIEVE